MQILSNEDITFCYYRTVLYFMSWD